VLRPTNADEPEISPIMEQGREISAESKPVADRRHGGVHRGEPPCRDELAMECHVVRHHRLHSGEQTILRHRRTLAALERGRTRRRRSWQSCQGIRFSREAFGRMPVEQIAGAMAEMVVDGLQPVQVDAQDGDGSASVSRTRTIA
jgi:hypothetical protein